jgi:hypothetical protein
VRSTEDDRGALDVALRELPPRHRRGPALAVAEVREDEDVEVVGLAELAQRLDVARVAPAEARVLADDDRTGMERLDEHLLDELLRRQARELGGEFHDQHRVESGSREEADPLGQRGERRRRALREEHRQGVRVERHGDRRRLAGTGLLDQLAQHRAVPTVHTVEVAECDDGPAEVGGDLRESVPDVHG